MPAELQSRLGDNWRQLLAIADLAGSSWPKLVRKIAGKFAERGDVAAIMLITDIKAIFTSAVATALHSDFIIARLLDMEDSPWSEWSRGRPMTPAQMAKELKGFGITPRQLKCKGVNKNGYELGPIKSACERYAPSTCLLVQENQGVARDSDVYLENERVDSETPGKPQNSAEGRKVDPPERGGGDMDEVDGVPHPRYGHDPFSSIRQPTPAIMPKAKGDQ
jgi:Protein of unknown function (DUF3631)